MKRIKDSKCFIDIDGNIYDENKQILKTHADGRCFFKINGNRAVKRGTTLVKEYFKEELKEFSILKIKNNFGETAKHITDSDFYFVTSEGNFYFLNSNNDLIKKSLFKKRGYLMIRIGSCKNKTLESYAHKIVAKYFADNYKEGMQIHHIDSNKSNNNVKNLQIINQSKHMSLTRFEEYKRNEKTIKEIRYNYDNKLMTLEQMSEKYGIALRNIHKICKRISYKWIKD